MVYRSPYKWGRSKQLLDIEVGGILKMPYDARDANLYRVMASRIRTYTKGEAQWAVRHIGKELWIIRTV